MKRYFKTAAAAEYLDVDVSFLKKQIGTIFHQGVHFYRPSDARLLRWDMEALDAWIQGDSQIDIADTENSKILQHLLG